MENYDDYFNTKKFLSFLGITFNQSEEDLKVNENKLPKLAFNKERQSIILYYPSIYGQQSFEFDPNVFNNAYQQAKFKHYTPKSEYLSFNDLFFTSYYSRANHYVQFIFNFFSINPTVIHKAIHQNKKVSRKIRLRPLEDRILKVIFGCNKNRYKAKKGGKNEEIRVDEEEERRIRENMSLAVKKTAQNYDMSYFEEYKENYVELNKLYHKNAYLTIRKKQKLLEKFQEEVDKIQRTML